MMLTILFHELGHLAMGLMTGYRLISLEVFGLKLTKMADGMRLSVKRKRFRAEDLLSGQCLMYPEGLTDDPGLLILGGGLMNSLTALAAAVILASGVDPVSLPGFFLVELAVYGVMSAAVNLFFGTETCDGATYRAVRADRNDLCCYNAIMLLEKQLAEGSFERSSSGELLKYTEGHASSLALELKAYFMFGEEKEKCEDN